MLKELKGTTCNWDVGLKGVARLEGKGLQLGRLQRPCAETGCHCHRGTRCQELDLWKIPLAMIWRREWKGASTEYQQTESAALSRKLFIMTKWDLS